MIEISQYWGRDGSVVYRLKTPAFENNFYSINDLTGYLNEDTSTNS